MNNNKEKTLSEKVIELFRYVARVNYSLDPSKNYQQYNNVTNGKNLALQTTQDLEAIKVGLLKACELSPKYFPKPQEIVNQIKIAANSLARHKPQDNSDYDRATMEGVARDKCKKEVVLKIGLVNTAKAEKEWCKLNNFPTKDTLFEFYKMELYAAINRQDQKALNIINAYEKQNRETN